MMSTKKFYHQTVDKKCKVPHIFCQHLQLDMNLTVGSHSYHNTFFNSISLFNTKYFVFRGMRTYNPKAIFRISSHLAETEQHFLWQCCCRWPVIWMWRVRIRDSDKNRTSHTSEPRHRYTHSLLTVWQPLYLMGKTRLQDRNNNSGYGNDWYS